MHRPVKKDLVCYCTLVYRDREKFNTLLLHRLLKRQKRCCPNSGRFRGKFVKAGSVMSPWPAWRWCAKRGSHQIGICWAMMWKRWDWSKYCCFYYFFITIFYFLEDGNRRMAYQLQLVYSFFFLLRYFFLHGCCVERKLEESRRASRSNIPLLKNLCAVPCSQKKSG